MRHQVDPPGGGGRQGAGRVARSRERLVRAARELLVEEGFCAVTMERVAGRSGVAKTTLYRHFEDRSALVAAVCDSLLGEAPPVPSGGSWREDARGALAGLAAGLAGSEWARVLGAVIDGSQRDERLARAHADFIRRRRAPLADVLRRGVAAGELPAVPEPEVLADLLVGPLFHRRFVSLEPITPELVAAALAAVLGGSGARPAAES